MSKLPETIALPGPIDLHVHLREPGTNHSETIESGTRAALLGGFVLICVMPNNPGMPTWTYRRLMGKEQRAYRRAYIPTAFYAGSQPESNNESELERMAERAIGLKLYAAKTTGNKNDYEAADFKDVVAEWHRVTDKPIMLHSGKNNLHDFINLIAKQLGHQLHVCHVNSPHDVNLVTSARNEGLSVTCGVCPHHLLMTSHDLKTRGEFARMQPPLASQIDAEHLLWLLARGEIDIVETDHAPHSKKSKWEAENEGNECNGVPGSEFAQALLMYQAKKNKVGLERLVEAMSTKPADIIGVRMTNHTTATWSMEEFRIEDEGMQVASGANWTPYLGMLALGKLTEVRILGQVLVRNGEIVNKEPRIINQNHII